MKKLLFIVALGVAGLVSAKNFETKNKISKRSLDKNESRVNKKKSASSCSMVTASCGATSWYCSDNKTWEGFSRLVSALEAIYCES